MKELASPSANPIKLDKSAYKAQKIFHSTGTSEDAQKLDTLASLGHPIESALQKDKSAVYSLAKKASAAAANTYSSQKKTIKKK